MKFLRILGLFATVLSISCCGLFVEKVQSSLNILAIRTPASVQANQPFSVEVDFDQPCPDATDFLNVKVDETRLVIEVDAVSLQQKNQICPGVVTKKSLASSVLVKTPGEYSIKPVRSSDINVGGKLVVR